MLSSDFYFNSKPTAMFSKRPRVWMKNEDGVRSSQPLNWERRVRYRHFRLTFFKTLNLSLLLNFEKLADLRDKL